MKICTSLVFVCILFFGVFIGVCHTASICNNESPYSSTPAYNQTSSFGTYSVVDVYPNGKRVVRGEATIGSRISSAGENYCHPLSADTAWFYGKQAAYVYMGFHGDSYQGLKITINDSKVNLYDVTEVHLGSRGFSNAVDYGFDCYEDLIVPDENNTPALINGTNGEIIYQFPPMVGNELFMHVATGDVDRDRGREVVIMSKDLTTSCVYLRVFDDWEHDFACITTINLTSYIPDEMDGGVIKITMSDLKLFDIDRDKLSEIFVSLYIKLDVDNGKYMYVLLAFDDGTANFENFVYIPSDVLVAWDSDATWFYDHYSTGIAIGDFDGDLNFELILKFSGGEYYRFNETTRSFEYIGFLSKSWRYMDYLSKLIAFDVDNDYIDEVVSLSYVSDADYEFGYVSLYVINFNETDIMATNMLFKKDFSEVSYLRANIGVGDYDGDVVSEIALAIAYRNLNYSDYPCEKTVIFYDDVSHEYRKIGSYDWRTPYEYPVRPILYSMAIDGIMLLHYLGIHNATMSRPYIIAVMAAPPTIENISQNYAGTATLFGTAITHTYSQTNGYSISTGIKFSFEAEDPLGIFEAHGSVELSRELERTRTVSQTIVECREFLGDYSNDYVIFETVLHDNFYYEVLSHPNKTYIGQKIAISIPHDPAIYKWTKEYFNDNNQGYPDIGSETLKHSIGKVWTYPTKADVLEYQNIYESCGFWRTSTAITVGSGKGSNSVELDLSTMETSETTTTIGVEFEAGFSVVGVGLSTSVGVSSKYVYSISIGESTKYRGDIGDIDPEHYNTYKYSAGLFVYNYYRSDYPSAYQVLNYWVQDYTGPHTIKQETPSDLTMKAPLISDMVDYISANTGLSPQYSLMLALGILITPFIAISYIFYRKKIKKQRKK